MRALIEAKVLLVKPGSLIEEETGTDNWLIAVTQRPEVQYADVNDRNQVERLMMSRKFGLDALQMSIHVFDDRGQPLIGYEVPSGLNIWHDYLKAIRMLMEQGKVSVSYGIDPLLLEMEQYANGQIRFAIRLELVPQHILTQFTIHARTFLLEILRSIEFLWIKMLHEYHPPSVLDISRPKDDGKERFIEINALRKWVLELPE
ncbi:MULTISPECIES: hypothetical protein [Paenibacillus]|uniref:Uncharacterized protein n=1 Tax=Paenibacillus illinoisensis TaxID=59845 RepID=A0A2W0CYB1_9BACL|nr:MULTISPECIES: hypothetical protein [Paenibacillus]MBM6386653.1 hypothetical protein [Paenibacillus sp.]PAD31786.1 hypothetical protein CHH60_10755 [Paenibacillus sp. 7523-1]PYY28641.1 hypothetical protein PIL02S_03847 [Paenibacillus illinoisensis]